MISMRNRTLLAGLLILFVSMTSCVKKIETDLKSKLETRPAWPETRFIVMSDLHYYDPALGISGKAFQEYVADDRKLLKESQEILTQAISDVSKETADFVIICGDLTKDGEMVTHTAVARYLGILKQSGKAVYVIPGNHDVANGMAVKYTGDKSERVPNISAEQFTEIYAPFGYQAALDRDRHSLSYLAEPKPGLWLLALDSCRWKENPAQGHPVTGGVFSADTMSWIKDILTRAKNENKAVLAMMHHGVLEHYPTNEKNYPEYLVKDYDKIARMFAGYGVPLVFTGHFHAQDITEKTYEGGKLFVFDVETGSLVTYPCPYRIVTITKDQQADIQSRFVMSIPSHPNDFREFAERYVYEGTINMANDALTGYHVAPADQKIISPQISRAYVTHLKGDEQKPAVVRNTDGLSLWGSFIFFMRGSLIEGWWTDLPPQDNHVNINLITGEVS
ncbi:MAG TPA: metallophosphoesterase [Desulfomonilia bacterium]